MPVRNELVGLPRLLLWQEPSDPVEEEGQDDGGGDEAIDETERERLAVRRAEFDAQPVPDDQAIRNDEDEP